MRLSFIYAYKLVLGFLKLPIHHSFHSADHLIRDKEKRIKVSHRQWRIDRPMQRSNCGEALRGNLLILVSCITSLALDSALSSSADYAVTTAALYESLLRAQSRRHAACNCYSTFNFTPSSPITPAQSSAATDLLMSSE
jgi:hypothetical protein